MKIRANSRRLADKFLFLFLLLFLLPSLACAQAGEILTPAEATARAVSDAQNALPATPSPTTLSGDGATSAPAVDLPYAAGDEVALAGKGFLINLVEAPGATRIVGSQERGAKVTVLEILPQGETIWVRIQAPTGEGWVKAENLAVIP